MYKRVLSVLLVVTISFSLAGCKIIRTPGIADNSSVSSVPTFTEIRKEKVVAKATEYLEENYPDDEFTYTGGQSPSWAYHEYTLVFSTKKYDDRKLKVYAITYDDDKDDLSKYEFYDTYYEYTVNDEAEKYFYDLFGEYISEPFRVKIDYFESYAAARNYQRDLSFYSNYEEKTLGFFVYVFIESNAEKTDRILMEIIEQEKKRNLDLDITRIIIDDLETVDDNTVQMVKDNSNFFHSKRKNIWN